MQDFLKKQMNPEDIVPVSCNTTFIVPHIFPACSLFLSQLV